MMNLKKNSILAALAMTLAAFAPATARAASANFAGGILTIISAATANDTDPITVTGTSGGNVKVNTLDVNPPTSASAVVSISVTGSAFQDTINLSAVSTANGFTGIAGTITVDAGAANDNITGSQFNDSLLGGANNDVFLMSAGSDILNGGATGNDIYRLTAPAAGATITILDSLGTDALDYDVYPSFIHELNITDSGTQITGTGVGVVDYSGATHPIETRRLAPTFTVTAGALLAEFLTGNAVFSAPGGNVQINGRNPAGGVTPANTVTGITVNGLANLNADNTLDLSGVTAGAFTSLTGVSVDMSRGNDTFTGSDFADTVNAGRGNDIINMSAGADTLYGNAGNDTFNLTAPANGVNILVDGDGFAGLPDYNASGAGDIINYDAQGHMVSDSGVAITGAGVGTVNHDEVESRFISGLPLPDLRLALLANDAATTLVFFPADILAAKPGWARATVTNPGLQDLVITAIAFENNPSGYFRFVGGVPPSTPLTVTSQSLGALPINLEFNPGVPVTEAIAHLKIVSNNRGEVTTDTFLPLRAGTFFDTVWNDSSGDHNYDNAANWSATPGPFSHLKIDGVAALTSPTKLGAALNLGVPAYPARLTLSGGGLAVGLPSDTRGFNVAQGAGSVAEITQTNGFLAVSQGFAIASGVDSIATCTLSGGQTRVAAVINVGQGGTGVMVVNGGSCQSQNVYVGGAVTGYGRLFVSAGDMSANVNMNIGNNGDGAAFISGSANITIAGALAIGVVNTARGAFDMAGGTLDTHAISSGSGIIAGWNWTGGTILTDLVTLPIPFTNDGGTLAPGGAGIGTTVFMAGTPFTQNAGVLQIGIDDNGAADQIITSGGLATFAGGMIDLDLINGGPTASGSWDIVTVRDGGSIRIQPGFTIPLPGPYWTVTSDTTRITVTLNDPAQLVTNATGGLAVFNNILLSNGDSASTKTIKISNAGDLDLTLTTISVTGTSFNLIQPLPPDLPKTLTANATDSITIAFESVTSGTYFGGLRIESNATSPTYDITLRASVLDTALIASSVEAWTRY